MLSHGGGVQGAHPALARLHRRRHEVETEVVAAVLHLHLDDVALVRLLQARLVVGVLQSMTR